MTTATKPEREGVPPRLDEYQKLLGRLRRIVAKKDNSDTVTVNRDDLATILMKVEALDAEFLDGAQLPPSKLVLRAQMAQSIYADAMLALTTHLVNFAHTHEEAGGAGE